MGSKSISRSLTKALLYSELRTERRGEWKIVRESKCECVELETEEGNKKEKKKANFMGRESKNERKMKPAAEEDWGKRNISLQRLLTNETSSIKYIGIQQLLFAGSVL